MEAWGAPTFRVKTMFATYSAPDTYGEPAAAWVKADLVTQDLLVSASPERFFVPPYVGPKGWVGVVLDREDTDWDELGALLADAWRMSVPKKLLARYPELAGG